MKKKRKWIYEGEVIEEIIKKGIIYEGIEKSEDILS